eukprot:TRINITY_DN61544_c0_g1_i1.p1 TRINITY_DN61544_c0_g1~~TRINITY_DN61544_c0_g1_i1.p1  ORF type:complete len:270 (-),score=73.09 TRINITY_DN61544_c0_g1_i1:491-1300(-)
MCIRDSMMRADGVTAGDHFPCALPAIGRPTLDHHEADSLPRTADQPLPTAGSVAVLTSALNSTDKSVWTQAPDCSTVLICLGDKSGGYHGPCCSNRHGLFDSLAEELPGMGVSVLQLRPCTGSTRDKRDLALESLVRAIDWARRQQGGHSVELLGWGLGGSVALHAAVKRRQVVGGVCTLSAPVIGSPTELQLAKLGSMEVMIAHGSMDSKVPPKSAQSLYHKLAKTGRTGLEKIKLYARAEHALLEQREEVLQDVVGWINEVMQLDEL